MTLAYTPDGGVEVVNNHLNTGVSVSDPWVQDVLWVNVVYGDDTTGTRNDPNRPFKTLNAAYAATPSGSQDTIYVMPTGNTGALISLTNADLTINKSGQIINLMAGPDTAPAMLNSTLTVTSVVRGNTYFDNLTIYNYSVDKLAVDCQMVNDHAVIFRRCYLYNGVGNKNAINTSGVWNHNVNAGSRLIFEACTFGGSITHGAGTVGAPFDMKGIMEIRNHHKMLTSVPAVLTINSGTVLISDSNAIMPCVLNGGALEIINSRDIAQLTSDGYVVKANDVDTVGKSFLTLRNFCCYSFMNGPAGVGIAIPKIKIGANVVYSLQNVIMPAASIEIDASAVEIAAYLSGLSQAEFVTYNSGKVYGSGTLIT